MFFDKEMVFAESRLICYLLFIISAGDNRNVLTLFKTFNYWEILTQKTHTKLGNYKDFSKRESKNLALNASGIFSLWKPLETQLSRSLFHSLPAMHKQQFIFKINIKEPKTYHQ